MGRAVVTEAPGAVYGTAGNSLSGTPSFAANADVARIGAVGESRTAAILNQLALRPGGPTVLHDLRIPIKGFSANIDHAIVNGTDVILIDTKNWKPGRYWTLRGVTRRGWSKFPAADKKTLPTAQDAINRLLGHRGKAVLSWMLVWPSNKTAPVKLGFFLPARARAITGDAVEKDPTRLIPGKLQTANPAVVQALLPWLN